MIPLGGGCSQGSEISRQQLGLGGSPWVGHEACLFSGVARLGECILLESLGLHLGAGQGEVCCFAIELLKSNHRSSRFELQVLSGSTSLCGVAAKEAGEFWAAPQSQVPAGMIRLPEEAIASSCGLQASETRRTSWVCPEPSDGSRSCW